MRSAPVVRIVLTASVNTYAIPVTLRWLAVFFCPERLYLRADAYTVADFLDAHLLEARLIQLHEVLAIDVVP